MLIDTNAESVVRTLKSEKQQAECTAARAAPIVFPRGRPFGAPAGTYSRPVDTPTPRRGAGASGKPPACIDKRQLCRKQFPLAGPDAPIPARGKGLQPYGALYCSGGDPKGPGASGKPPVRPPGAIPSPGGDWRADSGADRDLPSQGALTLFFRWRKKSVQKKASGTATLAARPAARYSQISAFRALPCPALVFAQACQSLTAYGSCAHWARAPSRPKLRPAGALRAVLCLGSLRSPFWGKSPLLPILTAGLAMSRAAELASLRLQSCALGARLFPPSKWAGLFPLRCLSPLCSPAVGAGQTQIALLGMIRRGAADFAR